LPAGFPLLSAQVAAKPLAGGKVKLSVHVNDAGDAVSGAHASAKGKSGVTNSNGVTIAHGLGDFRPAHNDDDHRSRLLNVEEGHHSLISPIGG
jgi:hypothetical protein